MQKNNLIQLFATVLTCSASLPVNSALSNNMVLEFDAGVTTCTYHGTCSVESGSYFGMDLNSNNTIASHERTAIAQHIGFTIGHIQLASGSHNGLPNGTESPNISQAWTMFGGTGLHLSNSPTNVISSSANTATLDFSGFSMVFNDDRAVTPLGAGAWKPGFTDGIANVTCATDCAVGDSYELNYSATIPAGDVSGFGGVKYHLYLTGNINDLSFSLPSAGAVNLSNYSAATHVWSPDVSHANNTPLNCRIVTPAVNGIATVEPDCSSGTYTPNQGGLFSGTDSFSYRANDGSSDSNIAIVSVDILEIVLPLVAINVQGGNIHECTITNGKEIYVSSDITPSAGDEILSTEWRLNGAMIQTASNFYQMLPIGDHNLSITVNTQSGHTVTQSTTIHVQDTTPPVVTAQFINRFTGLPVDTMQLNHNFIAVKALANDVCDPSAEVTDVIYGTTSANDGIFAPYAWQGGFAVPQSQMTLYVKAIDSAGNKSSGYSYLYAPSE